MRFDYSEHIDDHELLGALSASYSVDERTVVRNEYGRETVEGKKKMVKMGET